jgi:hypothetical protein
VRAPVAESQPNARTVVAAGTLAVLGGLGGLLLVAIGLDADVMSPQGDLATLVIVVGLAEFGALLGGAVLLLRGRAPGRWLVLAGCVLHLAVLLAAVRGGDVRVWVGGVLAGPPVATAVLLARR